MSPDFPLKRISEDRSPNSCRSGSLVIAARSGCSLEGMEAELTPSVSSQTTWSIGCLYNDDNQLPAIG